LNRQGGDGKQPELNLEMLSLRLGTDKSEIYGFAKNAEHHKTYFTEPLLHKIPVEKRND
jgi:hypothetical protein